MADRKDQNAKQFTREEIAAINPKYKGKPENFKRGFKPRFSKDDGKQAGPSEPRVDRDRNQKSQPSIPKPSNQGPSPKTIVAKESPIFNESIFTPHITVRENQRRTRFTPTMAQVGPLMDDVWNSMCAKNEQISKRLTFEAFRYFVIALCWLRIINLKSTTGQPMSDEEVQIRDQTSELEFNIPDPIYQFLHVFGEIIGYGTGQSMQPEFPPIPTREIGGIGGFYNNLANNNNINTLYEEIPCLGVTAEALCQSLNLAQAPGTRYASAMTINNRPVSDNLLGYRALSYRRNEAIDFLQRNGVTQQNFPSTVQNTGFNIQIALTISEIMGKLTGFKIHTTKMKTLSSVGSSAQLTITRPVNLRIGNNPDMCSNAEVRTTALASYPDVTFGIAQYATPQLLKESSLDPDASIGSRTWCCITFDANNPIPAQWVANRNVRRNLPQEYFAERFEVISQDLKSLRVTTLQTMAKD